MGKRLALKGNEIGLTTPFIAGAVQLYSDALDWSKLKETYLRLSYYAAPGASTPQVFFYGVDDLGNLNELARVDLVEDQPGADIFLSRKRGDSCFHIDGGATVTIFGPITDAAPVADVNASIPFPPLYGGLVLGFVGSGNWDVNGLALVGEE